MNGGAVKMSTIAKRRTTVEAGLDWQPTEDEEQMAVIEWKNLMVNQFPELKYLHHVPNGGSRHPAEAAKLERMGVVPGVSDLHLPVARGGFHGLWVEMKRQNGGKLSPAQKEWLDGMMQEGYLAVRADGAEQACEIIYKYLTEEKI